MDTKKIKETYRRLINKTMVEISRTPRDNPARFAHLHRKLKKYSAIYVKM
jgi:hypothetical protein